MSLKTRIEQDIKEAMKAKDQAALRALRAIKAAILLEETAEGSSGELSEADEMKLLQKQVKQRRDSIAQFRGNGREDLALKEEEEVAVIERFLPQQLSEAEVEAIVREIIAETGAASVKDMGKVMGAASKRLAGQADNKIVADAVKRLLS
jgi:hypothetical protein